MARRFPWPFGRPRRRYGGYGIFNFFGLFTSFFKTGGSKTLTQKQIRAIKAKEKKKY